MYNKHKTKYINKLLKRSHKLFHTGSGTITYL